MRTYLLEKSHVVHQAIDERSYHIFCQLCSNRETFPNLQLGNSEEYIYLASKQSSDTDRQSFFETVNALNTLRFSQENQDLKQVFYILVILKLLTKLKKILEIVIHFIYC